MAKKAIKKARFVRPAMYTVEPKLLYGQPCARCSYDYSPDFEPEDRKDRCGRCGLIPGKAYPPAHKLHTDEVSCFGCGAEWYEVPDEVWGEV